MKQRHPSLLALMLGLSIFLYPFPTQAAEISADETEQYRLFRLVTKPEKSDEYAAFIADLIIQMLLEERQKHLLFVSGEAYAASSSPQSSFGRFLVAKYLEDWNEAMTDLVGMLTRRGWLAAALSPQGVGIPMSMEVDNKVRPLISYIWPLLNQRDASPCEVGRNQSARCYATVWLHRNPQGDYAIKQMTITDADREVVHLPHVSRLDRELGVSPAQGEASEEMSE